MRGNSPQYQPSQYQPSQYQQSLRSPTSMSDSRTGRASPGLGNSMPEARPASYPQRPYSPQRPTQYDSAQFTKPGVDYGRPPVPSSYLTSTPTSAFSSDSIITTTTTTRHKNAWIEEARESTANFKKNGSPLPLVWVLIEDQTIPPNAVPFGEDRNGHTFFIARAHLEGGLHIGKVGHHITGALISFAGKEHVIRTYEVLVCASQLRWGLASQDATGTLTQGTVILARQQQGGQELGQNTSGNFGQDLGRTKPGIFGQLLSHTKTGNSGQGLGRSNTGSFSLSRETRESHSMSFLETTLRVDDIPRFNPRDSPQVQEEQLRRVAEYKTVLLIDDSISMTGTSWDQVGEALAGIVDIAMKYGSKGLDLYFMHEEQFAENIKTRFEVQNLFEQYGPHGEDTPTGVKLHQIIDTYLPLIEHPNSTHEPISIIVITDGAATDGDYLIQCIIDAASRLDKQQVPLDKFGIQFVQVGTDEEAARALQVLDDDLSDRYRIRDIVDSTPFDPNTQGSFNTDYMLKILIGSLNKELDNAPNEALSPERKHANLAPPVFDRRSPPVRSPYVPVGNLL
ncbi:hypothetical protein M405DRAFT_418668 [Rhizopogon salebrosus TDB-379]|nr:hypothetical protein M405DRAFT_418668 [Rhizopogon salebrosus TDB-379]